MVICSPGWCSSCRTSTLLNPSRRRSRAPCCCTPECFRSTQINLSNIWSICQWHIISYIADLGVRLRAGASGARVVAAARSWKIEQPMILFLVSFQILLILFSNRYGKDTLQGFCPGTSCPSSSCSRPYPCHSSPVLVTISITIVIIIVTIAIITSVSQLQGVWQIPGHPSHSFTCDCNL